MRGGQILFRGDRDMSVGTLLFGAQLTSHESILSVYRLSRKVVTYSGPFLRVGRFTMHSEVELTLRSFFAEIAQNRPSDCVLHTYFELACKPIKIISK